MRFFNTAGPVNPEEHYILPPIARFDLDEINRLIQQKKYFILSAPRQDDGHLLIFDRRMKKKRMRRYFTGWKNMTFIISRYGGYKI